MKKYEFTEESKEIKGHILRRIKAIRDFGDVRSGDFGGWIEKEGNLSHDGTCWVFDEACVYENAEVFGDAQVAEFAKIYGYAAICGHAGIWRNAEIYGISLVNRNIELGQNADIKYTRDYMCLGPIGSRNDYATFYLTETKDIWVRCGCFNDSIEKFEKEVANKHKNSIYEAEYNAAIRIAKETLSKRRGGEE